MKQSIIERIIWWWCSVFGHHASDPGRAEWVYGGARHYHCRRCRRIVSTQIKEPASHD